MRLAIPAAALFLAAAAGYVVAAGLERRGLKILTKPFAVPLLALAYVLAGREPNQWILAGLACGFAGDLFLIWPERKSLFAAGLAAFLMGHLAYLTAFLEPLFDGNGVAPLVFAAGIPLAVGGVLLYRVFRPSLGSLKIPVAVYMGVILAMGLVAVIRVAASPCLPSWLTFVGALCFLASDAMLGVRQFRGRGSFRFADALVGASYIGAQTLIVLGFVLEAGWRAA